MSAKKPCSVSLVLAVHGAQMAKSSKMCPTLSSPKALRAHILRVSGPKDHTM